MKHITLKSIMVVALAVASFVAADAQKVITNTATPKDLTAYNEQTVDLVVFRYIYKGWNTICLPISLTTDEINAIFGEDCRLETLVGVENTGTTTKLNFKDVKPDGLKARTPYILYSNQDNGVKRIAKSQAYVTTGPVELEFEDNTGTKVVFAGATEKQGTEGIYGILVKDNATAAFVDASNVANGIYATRCYMQLDGGETSQVLYSNHLDYDMTGIEAIANTTPADELVDVYNISGVRLASKIAVEDISKLGKGVYVVKGKKIWIR